MARKGVVRSVVDLISKGFGFLKMHNKLICFFSPQQVVVHFPRYYVNKNVLGTLFSFNTIHFAPANYTAVCR